MYQGYIESIQIRNKRKDKIGLRVRCEDVMQVRDWEPKDVGGLWKLEKARKGILFPQKEFSPLTAWF